MTDLSKRLRPDMLRPSECREAEIHVQHNGTVWTVTSHIDVQHQFEHVSEAMNYANHVRDRQRGEDRPRVILHRARSAVAE
jgi:hypothetical protein